MASPLPPVWLRISDYARFYGVSRKTVYKWIESGLLETYRVGLTIRVRHQPPTVQKLRNYVNRKQ